MRDVIHGIDSAALIVAELTSSNANVFYELGIAHGLLKPTVLLAQDINQVPFDLRSYRIIRYSTNFTEAEQLSRSLAEVARSLRDGTITFGSPVSDFAASVIERHGTIDVAPSHQPSSATPAQQMDDDEEGQPGMLDFQADIERSTEGLTEWMQRLGELSEKYTQRMEARSAEFDAVRESGGPGSAARMQTIGTATGGELSQYAQQVEEGLPAARDSWQVLVDATTNLVSTANFDTQTDRAAAKEFMDTLHSTRTSMSTFLTTVSQTRDSVNQLRNLSRSLDQAANRAYRALDGVVDVLKVGESYLVRMIAALEERLDLGEDQI